MKIGIIGSGISGLTAAYLLSKRHEVWLFEKDDWLGGHAHTVDIHDDYGVHAIDTGFIVCNTRTYPNFMHLLKLLDIELINTKMSFSVKAPKINLEYSGTNLNTIFAQRRNIFNPTFWNILTNINRFNKLAETSLDINSNITLQEFFDRNKISKDAQKYYILPIISAIWSKKCSDVLNMPICFIFKFLDNHGLLKKNSAPQWQTIKNGSRTYVNKVVQPFKNNIMFNTRVQKVVRKDNKVQVLSSQGSMEFDKIIFATHSDQVLSLLSDPTSFEQEIFTSFKYQPSIVTLHTDTNILPNKRPVWSSWNYLVEDDINLLPSVTYNMNILQSLSTKHTYCISLNLHGKIDPSKILQQYTYSHPIYDQTSVDNQQRWKELSSGNTFFCGAYWRYGFHEDGVISALRVVNAIDKDILCKTQFILGS